METLNRNLLITLLDFAQSDVRASVQRLALKLGVSRSAVAGALNDLAMQGLVSAETMRLTMMGLVCASSLRAGAQSTRSAAA
jgi:Mn-dependent DtxR family transcriptional regulator